MDSAVLSHYLTREQLTFKNYLFSVLLLHFRDRLRFTLKEIYLVAEGALSYHFPINNTVRASIRRNMQQLSKDGHLHFGEKRGTYYW